MRFPGRKQGRMFFRWLRSRRINGALILGYHRISDYLEDPFSICVKPENFSQHLEILQKSANVITLQDFVRRLQENRLPRRAVVLTFDDGYYDFLIDAKPLLESFLLPATIFVSTGSLGATPWWDELGTLILSSEKPPERLLLSIQGKTVEWNMERSPYSGASEEDRRYRFQLLEKLYQCLLPLSYEEQRSIISQLRIVRGCTPGCDSMPRLLQAEEVRELANSELLEVGSHSVSHPMLAALPAERQRFEITHSQSSLEEITRKKVLSFSYPNGSFLDSTMRIVKQAGYHCACASDKDMAWRISQQYSLPRFWIPDWDSQTFSRWLHRWIV